ncbi:MAG: UPF0182 family protein [Actinomycetaceae bacterium]|nr:UPF0182 family protein [Actinomycetaceae bacterium]MDY5854266.1 UPF0182 family protein [Arcanobacterium sp.]
MSSTTFAQWRPERPKKPRSSAKTGAFIPTLIVLAVLLAALVVLASFYTEWRWFGQIKAARVFWTQYGAFIAVGLVAFALTLAVVELNLWIATRGGALGKSARKRASSATSAGGDASADSVRADSASGGKPSFGGSFAEGFDPQAAAKLFSKMAGEADYRGALSGRKWVVFGLFPALLAVVMGARFAPQWSTFLLWITGGAFQAQDPEYSLNVSFYMFTLPALHELVGFFLILMVLSAVAAVVGYWLVGAITNVKGKLKASKKVHLHIGILAALITLGVAVNLWLSRYDLLLGNNARFSGATFTDINASKPGLTILAIVVALVALLFVWAGVSRKWKLVLIGIVSTVAVGMVLTMLYPFLMQKFKVDPNAAELESTYIQRNIDATLNAYGLDEVQTQQYAARTTAEPGQLRQDSETAAQIRLLDPNIVAPSYNQLQQNRQYYEFLDPLTVDRYTIDGQLRDTVIGVRELNLQGLSTERRSWVNDHTVYTHGFGVATGYGNTVTTKGDPSFWEAGIPSTGELGEYEPRVYFGQQSPSYSIVGAPDGADPWELDYPDDKAENGQVNTTYKGDGGPRIANIWDKLMYAIRFRSTELFFSDRVTNESQILFDRNPHLRVEKVAPYLTLDSKAVPAVVDMDDNPDTPKQLVWIIDGYTTSNNYPYSARETLREATSDFLNSNGLVIGGGEINYIRNSVKAVVNAYDGSVTLYQWDQEDPIINAWSKIFPGQITPLAKMPGDLIAHVRYPEDLFKVQRTLLARYHVTDAKSFYSGGDFWQVPREPTSRIVEQQSEAGMGPAQPPYYLTLQMPGMDSASFSLTTSYIPGGNTNRNVMTGFLAADSNAGSTTGKIADSYGKLRLLEAPRDLTVSGPGQAQNTMLAAQNVSTVLNLLRTGGTQVIQGNLLSLPIGGGLLYVQPIYVQASSGTQYPTLQYVLTLFGDQVGFAPTLNEALDQVFGGDSGVKAGDAEIAGTKEAPVPEGAGASGAGATSGASGTATPAPETPTPAAPSDTPPAAPVPTPNIPATGTAQEQLQNALNDAQAAVKEAESARQKGDWAAFGAAQDKLSKAVQQAVQAQQQAQQ